MDFPEGDYPGKDDASGANSVWIDKASISASISAKDNVQDWKKLIYKCVDGNLTSNIDDAVPPRMRESVEKLISKTTFLDDSYFHVVLTQLQTFLDMIAGELHQGFVLSEIANLCNFEYSMKGIKFKNHDANQRNWANTGGLFGYNRSGIEYTSCLESFKNHLLDEFKSDWRKITPGVKTDSEVNSRDYHHILDERRGITYNGVEYKFNTFNGINYKRSTTLKAIYDILNYPPTTPPDIIDQIFQDSSDKVRYINATKTTINGDLIGMFVADTTCNLFVKT